MIVGTPVSVNGKEYIIRFPIGALILAEKKLGWKLISLRDRAKNNDLSFEDMSILTRYGLHYPDGMQISEQDYQSILDNVGMTEFSKLFEQIGYALSGTTAPETETGKN